jgi:uncharacterized membrane protein YbhN (UPF0104 family)
MIRRLILWLIIIAFLWLVINRLSEIEKLAQTLKQGQWQWILTAIGLQAVYFLVFAASYHAAFDTVDVKSSVLGLLPVTISSLFVNVVTPTGAQVG